ncbi:mitochondrial substrate carrier family protein ucpB-like [Lingula anatina]|uniref:Mitochondrial substrate carrier family protein ucpB-like n=1 Tax=Lingula anatina TaxID=7574 RepID=A0A1S3HTV6_LINAN|nr:mitochondrial substrate carrier family protein ucpB-like [Lingula anatina]|eukprot:XP_013388976.1 mitochondrial substrate carrier family protein ucpB-like [Lingula anatina]
MAGDGSTLQYEQAWRFALAGTSNMCAAAVTNPIDVIKIRMQLDNELTKGGGSVFKDRYYQGFLKGGVRIVHDEGVRGLYKGLPASLMREGSYSTIRLGAYEPMKKLFGATDPAHTPLWKKICAGAVSGSIGSAIATPTDLVKVRMQAEGKLKTGQSARYNSTLSAFSDIAAVEGVRGLWTGVGPTVQRAAILTATQIPTYDHTKHTLLNSGLMTEGIPLHITSSMVAGFMTAVTTSPVDVVKTRVMNQKKMEGKHGHLYKSSWDCVVKTVRSEGILGLYKGFFPNWMRIGPHTIVTFFIFEQLRKAVGMAPV